MPVPSPRFTPRFLLFERRVGVTLARFSYFSGTCKYPGTAAPKYICPHKAEVSKRQYSSKAKSCNVHYFVFPMVQYCILGCEKSRTGSLTYLPGKQKYQNGNIHRKLKVPTSEREGKLSNPRARAMHGENLRKFTETRAAAPRARYAVISCRS